MTNLRIKNLSEIYDSQAAFLLCGPNNVRYFSGYTGEESVIVIYGDKRFFITDFRYIEQAKKQVLGFDIVMTQGKSAIKTAIEIILYIKAEKLAIDENKITAGEYLLLKDSLSDIEIFPCEDEINKIRSIKDENEISIISKAARKNDEFFEKILNFIKPGVSENDLKAELYYMMHKDGLDIAFNAIIASGENSSLPHAQCSGRKIQTGDFITFDFGCKKDGYCSDFTRTVAVGSISDQQKRVYEVVREANKLAFDSFRLGMKASKLDDIARNYIKEAGYEKQFGHSLGHGVGLDIHELPRISSLSDMVLTEGMVFTIEPGIYIEGKFGVRIEDICAIKNEKLVSLSIANRQLIIV
ncbi:MAG: aminopeptidase P family protein [Eubacteriales bacterium]